MSPYEIVQDWQEIQRESRERLGISEKGLGEILGELTFATFDMLMRLFLGLPPEDEEQKAQSSH